MKIRIVLLMLFASISGIKSQNICNNPASVAYSFVKSVTTKDSALFYSCVHADVLKNNMIKKISMKREIEKSELHLLFFLKYGPWKIKRDELRRRASDFERKSNIVLNLTGEKDGVLKVLIEYNEELKMRLILEKFESEWKIADLE